MNIKVNVRVTKKEKKQLIQKLGYHTRPFKKMFEDLGYTVVGDISVGILRSNDLICWKKQEEYDLFKRVIFSLTISLGCAGGCRTCPWGNNICIITKVGEEMFGILEDHRLDAVFEKYIETTIKEQVFNNEY
jgi:hypothetical protein